MTKTRKVDLNCNANYLLTQILKLMSISLRPYNWFDLFQVQLTNVGSLFRAFVLSCFRDCVLEFSARKSTNSTTNRLILPVFFFFFLCSAAAEAALHDLGTFGATYPIVEKDAIEEIKEKASKTDWSKHFNKKKIEEAVKGYRPERVARLPRATQDRTFRVDMSYTIDFDIPDGKGGILYPKGYTFNPLDYVQFPNVLVVIDASDKEQVTWLGSSEYVKDYRTMLLVTDGGFWDLSHNLKRPVFYAARQIVERLQLKAVPSVIRQSGRYMEINEIAINNEDNKNEFDSGLSPVSVSSD